MSSVNESTSIEPLFAASGSLWLRVWIVTQSVALGIAVYVMIANDQAPARITRRAPTAELAIVVALLVIYHAAGFRAHRWILQRGWATALFVPLGWVLIVGSLRLSVAFALLVLGAIIQGFVFLPFAWAIAVLAGAAALPIAQIIKLDRGEWSSLAVARISGVLATAVMIGTVMLYIHRANRDAAIRRRLMRELEETQRDLADRAREAGVQDERQRLARDLHDTLAQAFTSVVKHLEAVELSFADGNGDGRSAAPDATTRALAHVAHAENVSRESLAELRRIVWALRPAPLAESSLAAAIERITKHWGEANGIATTATIDDALPALQPDAEVILLRATQELLSNVAKHAGAGATRVEVSVSVADGLVMLSVEDDGRGIGDIERVERADGGGMGLRGIRERARPFGGRVMVDTSARGTSVTVALPCDAVSAAAT